MHRYLFSKLAQSLLLLFGVLFLVFMMVRVTGDPAALMMPRESSPEQIEAFREELGFNDSALHWDLVNTEPKTVTAHLKSGKSIVVYEDGMFKC